MGGGGWENKVGSRILFSNTNYLMLQFTPHKGIWIPESMQCLLLKSQILENCAGGIWNPGLWNPEYSSRSPESN